MTSLISSLRAWLHQRPSHMPITHVCLTANPMPDGLSLSEQETWAHPDWRLLKRLTDGRVLLECQVCGDAWIEDAL